MVFGNGLNDWCISYELLRCFICQTILKLFMVWRDLQFQVVWVLPVKNFWDVILYNLTQFLFSAKNFGDEFFMFSYSDVFFTNFFAALSNNLKIIYGLIRFAVSSRLLAYCYSFLCFKLIFFLFLFPIKYSARVWCLKSYSF